MTYGQGQDGQQHGGQQNGAPQHGGVPQAPGTGPTGGAVERPSRGFEIAGFVLSFFGILAIAGLVMSTISFRRLGRAGQPRGLSLAGIIISIVVLLLTIGGIVAVVTGVSAVVEACQELGPGTHVVDGVTYTCS
jgi:Na+/proline symporter